MKLTVLLAVFILSSIHGFSKKEEIKLGKIKVFRDLVEVSIPAHFVAIPDFEMKEKYANGDMPKIVYSDSIRSTYLAFYSKRNDENADVLAHKASVYNSYLSKDAKLKLAENAITQVDGRDMGYLNLLMKEDKKMGVFYFLTIHSGLVLSGELKTSKKLYKIWQPVAVQIMNSVSIKGK